MQANPFADVAKSWLARPNCIHDRRSDGLTRSGLRRGKDLVGVAAVIVVGILASTLSGCAPRSVETPSMEMHLELEPSQPVVGISKVALEINDAQGQAIQGANVQVEGNMNHAGMKPSFASLTEVEPGKYSGDLKFTMGGDWFLLVTVTRSDGHSAERKFDIPGVKVE